MKVLRSIKKARLLYKVLAFFIGSSTVMFILIMTIVLTAVMIGASLLYQRDGGYEPAQWEITGHLGESPKIVEMKIDTRTALKDFKIQRVASSKGKGASFVALWDTEDMSLPSAGSKKIYSYMAYDTVTDSSSSQYQILNSDSSKTFGLLRKYDNDYLVALGTFYGSVIGQRYRMTLEDPSTKKKKTVYMRLGDVKSDAHTDSNHQYHRHDKSIVELIVGSGATHGEYVKAIRKVFESSELVKIEKMHNLNIKIEQDGSHLKATGQYNGWSMKGEGGFRRNSRVFTITGSFVRRGKQSGKFIKPVVGVLTSPFNLRVDPFNKNIAVHEGVDWGAPTGTPVIASQAGKVIKAGVYGGYGNLVIIKHKNGYETRYGHLSKFLVKEGQSVNQGDIIALVGSTGRSTGPHLHFEIRLNGKALDPLEFVGKEKLYE